MSTALSRPLERGTGMERAARREYAAGVGFVLSPGMMSRALGSVAIVLVLASTVLQVYRYRSGDNWLYGLVPAFYLDVENNVPTHFSALLLAIGAALLSVIAVVAWKRLDRHRWRWALLAVVCWMASFDEAASLHEMTIEPIRNRLPVGGVLYFAWVVPGAVAAGLLAAFCWPVLRGMSGRVRRLSIAAALLFLGGAIGVEMLGGWWADRWDVNTPVFAALVTVEESLEMAGVIVLIHAMVLHLAQLRPGVQIRFAQQERTA